MVSDNAIVPGTVYLIGAGPGDPGLITVRGLQLLQTADVIVYDRLAHPSLLQHARAGADKIYVGKASSQHAMRQPDINELLVQQAHLGKMVARLKGGDPYVFGRGGEEAARCREAGIKFEVVPGVTSAIAAGAYAGIPVTHRDAASSFAVITGHERDDQAQAGKAEGRRNWKNIANAADTLVFLMGIENLAEISCKLIDNGRSSDTPAALVQWGTWPTQRVVTGVLENIVEVAANAQITSPAVCIVGDVVSLREQLRWFDDTQTRPLFGKRILVTRAREQASVLSDKLRLLGADPIEFPTIKIVARENNAELDSAIESLSTYEWLVFTSPNGVDVFADEMLRCGRDARQLAGCRIAALGPATASQLRLRLGVVADYVPGEAVAEAVLAEWPDKNIAGKSILLPRAAEARDVLPDGLRAMGATVDVIPVYDTVLDTSSVEQLKDEIASGSLQALTFTSSSTVTNLIQAIGTPSREELQKLLKPSVIFAIGPVTARTLSENGVEAVVVSADHTIPGLLETILNHYSSF